MARDEALLLHVGSGQSPPTLRLYLWSPPTISLGYFQSYQEFQALPAPAGQLPVVRRLTGGGAILHDRELTYSLTVPIHHPVLRGGPNRLYEIMHDAIIAVLGQEGVAANRCGVTRETHHRAGPFFCFARRHCLDVVIHNEKVAGSAQRRTKQAVLQHGSLILERQFTQQESAEVGPWTPERIAYLGSAVPMEFSTITGASVVSGQWSSEEMETADGLSSKYADEAWTRRL